MKKSLALSRAAKIIPRRTVALHLRDVPSHRTPSTNLSVVIFMTPSQKISAIPLKPTSRIIRMNPPILSPNGQWLTGIYFKVIELRIMPFVAKLYTIKPITWKLICAIAHILSSKHTETQHFFRSQIGRKL